MLFSDDIIGNAQAQTRTFVLFFSGVKGLKDPSHVFGLDADTMEAAVLRELQARQLTLGVAESLTGGLIASRIVDVPGASASFRGAVVGSFLTLFITLVLSFPIGVAAAVYLEEFAPKNKWTDLIEVNINNLAAVPSIVFGLFGNALFCVALGLGFAVIPIIFSISAVSSARLVLAWATLRL